jgi:recombination protein RecA
MSDLSELKEKFGNNILDYSKISRRVLEGSFISSGSRNLNIILTGNSEIGWVRGRIYELFGPEGSGKTTIGQCGIVDCQKKNGKAMFVDAEKSFNPEYAESIGINLDKLIVTRPLCGEEGFDMIIEGIKMNMDYILVDSIAALVPRAEIENDMDKQHMGAHGVLMGKGLRKVLSELGPQPVTTIVFLNQIRLKIGVMFGNPETRPGGKAMGFFSTGALLEVRDPRSGKVLEGSKETGKLVVAKSIKNKVFSPFLKCQVPIVYGKGIDKAKDLALALESKGMATISGKTLTIKGFQKMNSATYREKLKDKSFSKKLLGMLK